MLIIFSIIEGTYLINSYLENVGKHRKKLFIISACKHLLCWVISSSTYACLFMCFTWYYYLHNFVHSSNTLRDFLHDLSISNAKINVYYIKIISMLLENFSSLSHIHTNMQIWKKNWSSLGGLQSTHLTKELLLLLVN